MDRFRRGPNTIPGNANRFRLITGKLFRVMRSIGPEFVLIELEIALRSRLL